MGNNYKEVKDKNTNKKTSITDIYNLIDNLKSHIKKLDINKNHIKNNDHKDHEKTHKLNIMKTFRVCNPCNIKNKKYIGLLFDNNFDQLKDDEDINIENCASFIKLKRSNNIINYSITFDIKEELPIDTTGTLLSNILKDETTCNYCLTLGIKDKKSSKIRIIKGSKNIFNLSTVVIVNNKFIVNSTILYSSNDDDELCLIAELDDKLTVNSKKSLIKILMI